MLAGNINMLGARRSNTQVANPALSPLPRFATSSGSFPQLEWQSLLLPELHQRRCPDFSCAPLQIHMLRMAQT